MGADAVVEEGGGVGGEGEREATVAEPVREWSGQGGVEVGQESVQLVE